MDNMDDLDDLTWRRLDDADVPCLRDLARACLDADGGLPLLLGDGLLRARLLRDVGTGATDREGRLVAAASVSVARGPDGRVTTSGLVHPLWRRRGLGTSLLSWATDRAGERPLVVETECSSPAAERLYARLGLGQVFAERVLRHDLATIPEFDRPMGVMSVPVSDARPEDLYVAYVGSFADRPGFPDPSQEQWLGDLASDPDWDREVSRVVLDGPAPVAFVTVVGEWVDQVGVVPTHRGRGLGAHLICDALDGLRSRGAGQAWLTVEVSNPAAALYERVGFAAYGTRARFA